MNLRSSVITLFNWKAFNITETQIVFWLNLIIFQGVQRWFDSQSRTRHISIFRVSRFSPDERGPDLQQHQHEHPQDLGSKLPRSVSAVVQVNN